MRAATAMAEGDLYGSALRDQSIRDHESKSFYLTTFVVKQLEEYRTNRDRYPKLTDFIPVLLDRLSRESQKARSDILLTQVVLWSVLGLGVFSAVLAYRRHRGPSAL